MIDARMLAAEGPNGWWLPSGIWDEVIWASLAFAVVMALFFWKGWAPLKAAIARRSDNIREELAAAEHAEAEAAARRAEAQAALGDPAADSRQIIADAHERAAALKADLIARAEADVAASKQRARLEIESSKSQVLADLRAEVSARTIAAAEAVASSNLDDAAHANLIEQYIQQVGQAAGQEAGRA
ncbi:MAG: F0F1 ATP synthase subunit B [Acidimicrobiales bacterium]|nr:F0F1 ATP synthase subunit B [Acidimicrobiales bacterium]